MTNLIKPHALGLAENIKGEKSIALIDDNFTTANRVLVEIIENKFTISSEGLEDIVLEDVEDDVVRALNNYRSFIIVNGSTGETYVADINI